MDIDKNDSLGDKLTNSNYMLWAIQFSTFVKGKWLLEILDGSSTCPKNPAVASDAKVGDPKVDSKIDSKIAEVALWKSNNAKIKN
ncbi:hypothetical protein LINGRAHAP2_LOCUS31905 [Linum grandiflorum]